VTACHPAQGDCEHQADLDRTASGRDEVLGACGPGHVPRPHPHGALDAAAQLPLTVVVGVPGAGKSVMLQSWLRDRPGLRPTWLSCDARDADPVTFWLALSATLTQAWPGRWLDVADLLAENEPDLDDVAVNPAQAVRKHADRTRQGRPASGPGRLRPGLHRSGREDWGLDPEP
jgi:hypothetical protein